MNVVFATGWAFQFTRLLSVLSKIDTSYSNPKCQALAKHIMQQPLSDEQNRSFYSSLREMPYHIHSIATGAPQRFHDDDFATERGRNQAILQAPARHYFIQQGLTLVSRLASVAAAAQLLPKGASLKNPRIYHIPLIVTAAFATLQLTLISCNFVEYHLHGQIQDRSNFWDHRYIRQLAAISETMTWLCTLIVMNAASFALAMPCVFQIFKESEIAQESEHYSHLRHFYTQVDQLPKLSVDTYNDYAALNGPLIQAIAERHIDTDDHDQIRLRITDHLYQQFTGKRDHLLHMLSAEGKQENPIPEGDLAEGLDLSSIMLNVWSRLK